MHVHSKQYQIIGSGDGVYIVHGKGKHVENDSLKWVGSIVFLKVFVAMSVPHLIGRYSLTYHLW